MFLLFEEAGKFIAGRVLSEAEASVQVELDSGKRVKVKGANVLLKFEKPAPAQLLAEASLLAKALSLIWLGNLRPKTNLALPMWRVTISTQTPAPCSRWVHSCAFSKRRIISAELARVALKKLRPKPFNWP
jgi:hypothetical protein